MAEVENARRTTQRSSDQPCRIEDLTREDSIYCAPIGAVVESGGSFVSGKVSLTFLQQVHGRGRPRPHLCFLNWNFGHLIFQNPSFGSDAPAVSVRCNKTAGRNQEMIRPRHSGTGAPQLRLLLVGGSEQEFAELRSLLVEADAGRFYLNQAASAEGVLNEFERNNYDLLFCGSQSTDDAAFQLLRQVREHDSRVSVFFLGNPVSKGAVEAAIQAATSQHVARGDRREPRGTLADVSGFKG